MADLSYARSVAAFEALVGPVQDQQFSTPAALIRRSGLPMSTGYRHLTTLEGEGLLTRDKYGTYVVGPTALRIGLSAFGVGHLAVLAPPILSRLREVTGRTAFLAVLSGNTITICAFSMGRDARGPAPARLYKVPRHSAPLKASPREVFLAQADVEQARFCRALLYPVPSTGVAHIGLFTGSEADGDAQLSAHLKDTAALFQNNKDATHDP